MSSLRLFYGRGTILTKSVQANPRMGIRSTLRAASKEKREVDMNRTKGPAPMDIDEHNWEHLAIKYGTPDPPPRKLTEEEQTRIKSIMKAKRQGEKEQAEFMNELCWDLIKKRDLAIKALPENMQQHARLGFADSERWVDSYWDARKPTEVPGPSEYPPKRRRNRMDKF